MKLIRRLAALALAAAVAVSSSAAAFADNELVTVPQQTTAAAETTTDTTDAAEEETSRSRADITDSSYTPIDVSTYQLWDGKTKMQSGVNYYIDSAVGVTANTTLPADSTLVLLGGSQLTLYKGYKMYVRGRLVIEPSATLLSSGDFSVYTGGGLDNYGSFKGSVSSVTRVYSDFVVHQGAKNTISGEAYIYKDGVYLNYGSTTLTANSKLLITGELQTSENGRLINKGYMAVTISGRSTQAGYYYLSGEFVNSGVFIFESTVHYYKTKTARFAVSKSSRLIDYRRKQPTHSSEAATTDKGIKGIDVSYAQGAVDWNKVKAAGIKFAMIRASRGYISDAKPMAVDKTFEYNITQATYYQIDVGVYHYLYATTVEEAREEARFLLETIKPYKITYPVVLDIEEQYQADLGKSRVTALAKAFLEEIEKAGYYGMIYANKHWLTTYLDVSQLSDYDVWLAQWNTVPTYTGDFGMWQYSAKGVVSGIDTYVDLNLAYKDYAKIIREGGYNNLK